MTRLTMMRVHYKDNDCITRGLAFQIKPVLFGFHSRHPPVREDQHFEPKGEGKLPDQDECGCP